jgi:hypothetical protein
MYLLQVLEKTQKSQMLSEQESLNTMHKIVMWLKELSNLE